MKVFRILFGDNGQLCNRFWSYVGHVLWALKNDSKIYVLTWNPNIFDYPNLLQSKHLAFSFNYVPFFNLSLAGHRPFNSLLQHLLYSNWFNSFIKACSKRYPKEIIKEWPPSYDNFKQEDLVLYKSQLRTLFEPKSTVKSVVDSLFHDCRKDNLFIIGVHIRRGDYATWKDGKYCYSFERYAEWMNQVSALYPTKKVCFYLASAEKVPESILTSFCTRVISNASAATDLYALSQCDRIIGPPSSFSRWASFINDVPLYFLTSKESNIVRDSDFSPVLDQDYFQNGIYFPVNIR